MLAVFLGYVWYSLSSSIPVALIRFTNFFYNPLWNRWWSLQSDWLSALWFIPESHHFLFWITSVLNHVIHFLRVNWRHVWLNRTFSLYIASFLFWVQKFWGVRAFLFLLWGEKASLFLLGQINIDTDWILWFQNGCNKVVFELCVVQFWSEIILVISNWTSDQIALHSVQLPVCMYTVGSIFMISLIMVMQSLSLTFYTIAKVKVFFWGYNKLITSATLILNNNLYCYRMYFVFFQ